MRVVIVEYAQFWGLGDGAHVVVVVVVHFSCCRRKRFFVCL